MLQNVKIRAGRVTEHFSRLKLDRARAPLENSAMLFRVDELPNRHKRFSDSRQFGIWGKGPEGGSGGHPCWAVFAGISSGERKEILFASLGSHPIGGISFTSSFRNKTHPFSWKVEMQRNKGISLPNLIVARVVLFKECHASRLAFSGSTYQSRAGKPPDYFILQVECRAGSMLAEGAIWIPTKSSPS